MMKKLMGLGVGFLVAVPALWATQAAQVWGPQEPPFRPERPIVIQGGTLIDATGAPPKLDHAVVIEDENITWVGSMKDVSIPAGAQVIDARGMTIMPGLINSNQHTQLNPLYHSPGGSVPLAHLKAQWEESWSRIPQRSFVYLMQGVTSMRNTSGPASQLILYKNAIDNGEIPGPRIFLGGALLMSRANFEEGYADSPPDTKEWMRTEFAFVVVDDPDKDTDRLLGPDFNYWKFVMSSSRYDGKNDFSDDDVRFIIDKARKNGKFVDVHCGGHNDGLRRMLAFDFDTLEHPFYGGELIEEDIIEGYVEKGVVVDTLLEQMIARANRAADPHRFDESLYIMSMTPKDYRILMRYRDKMAYNRRHPDEKELVIHGEGRLGMTYNERQERRQISRENMRRFIRAGAKFSMGTDTPAFMNLQQEDPNANEMRYMVEMGMSPMQVIQASTKNGAEILGLSDKLGTIEAGKWADVIVVAGNPLDDMKAMKRVAVVIKGGVRYK